ncbi:hypothetical protein ADL06_25950 [Streptomyces sp. NRRL F-6491]|nr:hypothetical protein ADL06_25950 [Streptomyces sp. NRRL F-6491]KOX38746.1 hypothetical protein ADL08_27060 [Streptomyces sp. NRRL F-6492]
MPLRVIGAALAGTVGLPARLAVVVRRRGTAGAAIGAATAARDEAFRVTAHESYHEIRAQAERKAPVLSPDGPWGGSAPLPRHREGHRPHRKNRPGRRSRFSARLRRG